MIETYLVPATSFYSELDHILAALRAGHKVHVTMHRIPVLQIGLIPMSSKSISSFKASEKSDGQPTIPSAQYVEEVPDYLMDSSK